VFRVEEDLQLTRAVEDLGANSWDAVADRVTGRNPRQCRDRWRYYLAPDVDNGPWTSADEELLISKQEELGPAWKKISRFFPCRTDINVKSRWHQIQRRLRRRTRAADDGTSSVVDRRPELESAFDEIWKTHMTTDDTVADILYGGWY
jgi:hypothetical protein